MEGGAAAVDSNNEVPNEETADARRFSFRKLLFKKAAKKKPEDAPPGDLKPPHLQVLRNDEHRAVSACDSASASVDEGSPPLAVWRNPSAGAVTLDRPVERTCVPSPECSALPPAGLRELRTGAQLGDDPAGRLTGSLPGGSAGILPEVSRKAATPLPHSPSADVATPQPRIPGTETGGKPRSGKSRWSDPARSKHAQRTQEDLAAPADLFPSISRKSAPHGSPKGSPARSVRPGHSHHRRGSRSGGVDGSSPQLPAQHEHDPELGPPPMPGASPGMLAAQYEAWQRARAAKAVAPVSRASTSSGPSTATSSQQGTPTVSQQGSGSPQSGKLVFDFPTKADRWNGAAAPSSARATSAAQRAAVSPEPPVSCEVRLGDGSPAKARSRAALRAAAAAAGPMYGL